MEQWWHGIIASAPSDKAGILLRLVAEKMLHPRLDYEEFEGLRGYELENYGEESYLSKLMKSDNQRLLNTKLDSLMGNLTYGRRLGTTKEDLRNMSLDAMGDFYKALYSNPDGMTCVVCGSFNVDEFIAQAVPVFGKFTSMESNKYGVSYYTQPKGLTLVSWPNANQTQTAFDYLLYGKYEPSLRGGLILKLMQNLVRNRLISVLREGCSLVYSPYISLYYNAVPDNVFYFDINASVDRKNTAVVHKYLDDIVKELKAKKVSKKELQTIKQIFIVNKRNYLQNDATSGWKSYLVGQLKNGESLADLENYEAVLADITPEDIREAFTRLIDLDNQVILSIGEFTPCEN